jgi:hypothetical protein
MDIQIILLRIFFAWSAEDVGGRLRGKAERAGGEGGVLIEAAKIKKRLSFSKSIIHINVFNV